MSIVATESYSHKFSPALRTILLGSVAVLALPVTGFAQEAAEDAAGATALPSMTVTGSRAPEHYRLEETAPVVKVTREVYEQWPTGLRANDVVQRLPGVYTGGGPGENKDLRLRGLDKEYSRVQVDGVTLPDGGEKRELNLDRLPNFLVDEIKIIRNPTADIEADGLAGRLHVKTREIPVAPTLEMQAGVGSVDKFGTQARQMSVAYGERVNERFGFQTSLSYAREPNDKRKETLRVTGTVESQEREIKPATYLDAFVDAGLFYGTGEIHLKPMYQYQIEDKHKGKYNFNANGTGNGGEMEDEYKPKETAGLGIENKHKFSGGSQLESRVGFYTTREWKDKDKRTFNSTNTTTALSNEVEDKTDQIWNGGIAYSHPFEAGSWGHKVKVGTDLRYRERGKSKATKNYLTGVVTVGAKDIYKLTELYRAGYVMDEIAPTDRLTLSPGVRYEAVNLTSTDRDGPLKSSFTQDPFLPSIPVNYRLTDKLALKAAASRVITRPKFDEIMPYEETSGTTLKIGNESLQPERAWAFDSGFDYVDEKFFFGFNFFYRLIEDHLETRNTGETRTIGATTYTVQQMQNVGDGILQGIELEQRIDLDMFGLEVLKPFRITANESFIRSEVTDNTGKTTPFAQQPEFIANVILDWNYVATGTKLSLAVNHVGPINRYKALMDSFEPEQFWDFKATQKLADGVEAFLLFENLTDESRTKHKSDGKTEKENGGRTFFLGTTAKF